MVRWEAALIAVYGTVLGLLIGLGIGRALVFAIKASGIETAQTVVPVGQLAVIVALAGACGVVAAAAAGPPGGPARRAGRGLEHLRRGRPAIAQVAVRWKFWNDLEGVGPRCPW